MTVAGTFTLVAVASMVVLVLVCWLRYRRALRGIRSHYPDEEL